MLYCISVNYKNFSAEIRSKFAFDKTARQNIREDLKLSGIFQSVILCTCNRTEVYFVGDESCDTENVLNIIRADENVRENIGIYRDKQAVKHLFRVCCGIDSMILGEDEILGQTRNAYYESLENNFSGYEINTIFQSAIACAKKIKTETELSRSSVSAATLAANEAASFAENVNVLVIGSSGNIGSSVLKNLTAHKNVTVTRTVRTHSGFQYIPRDNVKDIAYSARYKEINDFDCVISATASPHFTITYKGLAENFLLEKKLLLIDLAVPSDIESSVKNIEGVTLIGIDHFNKLAENNNLLKISAAEQAENIISEEIDELFKKIMFHEFLPHIENVKNNLMNLSFEEIIFELRDSLSSSEFGSVIKILERL